MTFDEFVGARLGPLLRYATVVTCDPHLAQDVVQEVLLRAQQRWRRIARVEQPEAYVKRMVLNEFLSWRRRVANRVLPMERGQLDRATPPAEDPARQLVERDALLARIAGLPPRQRAPPVASLSSASSPLPAAGATLSLVLGKPAFVWSLVDPRIDGVPATIRDRPGFVRLDEEDEDNAYIEAYVELDAERDLLAQVSPPVPEADLIRICDELEIGPMPYTGWVGQR